MNRFAYAQANPWTFSDPSGHATCFASADLCDETQAIKYQGTPGGQAAAKRAANQDRLVHVRRRLANYASHHKASTRAYETNPQATPETAFADQDTWGESTRIAFASAAGTAAQAAAPPKPRFICGGRSGCMPDHGGGGDVDWGTVATVGLAVAVGVVACILACAAIAASAAVYAGGSGLIAAAGAGCMVICPKLATIGSGINAGLGGASPGGAAVGGGAARAEQFAANWPSASLTGAVDRLLVNEVTAVSTTTGKTIYSSASTTLRVVSDNAGGYFRVENSAATGIDRYLSQYGNAIPANVPLFGPGGTSMVGVPRDVRRALTHFLDEDPL